MQACLYCRGPCDADAFASPVWSCAWCRCNAHVSCYRHLHPAAAAAPEGAKEKSAAEDGAGAPAAGRQGQPNGLAAEEAGALGQGNEVEGLRRWGDAAYTASDDSASLPVLQRRAHDCCCAPAGGSA